MGESYVNDCDLAEGCTNPREVYFLCRHCGRPTKVVIGCGKRFESFCPACAARWRRRTFTRYYRGVCAMHLPKFLTLTLRKDGGRMEARLKGLWEAKKYLFKKLKRLGYSIPSWCGVIEPPNHIHLVIDTRYIPQSLISELWEGITGDSYIVDIRKVNSGDLRQVAAYITKYLTKASNWEGINLDKLAGFHLIGSWNLPPGPPKQSLCICGVRALYRVDAEGFYAVVTGNDRIIRRLIGEGLNGRMMYPPP